MNSTNFEESIVILFYGFLKQRDMFKELYDKRIQDHTPNFNKLVGVLEQAKGQTCKVQRISDLWLDYGLCPKHDYDNMIALRLSQLWRFYLLDNMKEVKFNDAEEKDALKSKLCVSIEANGLRESEEVKEYFKKYNLKTKFNI
jgi:hypothetical protein